MGGLLVSHLREVQAHKFVKGILIIGAGHDGTEDGPPYPRVHPLLEREIIQLILKGRGLLLTIIRPFTVRSFAWRHTLITFATTTTRSPPMA